MGSVAGNCGFCADVNDLAVNWTRMNLGEVTFAFGRPLDRAGDILARRLMRVAGVVGISDLPSDDSSGGDDDDGGGMGIFVMHADVHPRG